MQSLHVNLIELNIVIYQGEDFEIYEKYADDILKPHGRERLSTLLQRSDISLKLQVSVYITVCR